MPSAGIYSKINICRAGVISNSAVVNMRTVPFAHHYTYIQQDAWHSLLLDIFLSNIYCINKSWERNAFVGNTSESWEFHGIWLIKSDSLSCIIDCRIGHLFFTVAISENASNSDVTDDMNMAG